MKDKLGLRAMVVISLVLFAIEASCNETDAEPFRLATFSADVTCPIGHPLLGGIVPAAAEIVDPLEARGFVLLGPEEPIVFCAIDWCEIRNRSYDDWREALADAAETRRERVLVCSVHQHDAPLTDRGAAEILAEVGLQGVMFDRNFERVCIERTASTLRSSLKDARHVTHYGIGKAKVERIASNRRVVTADGRVSYDRGSNAGGNKFFRNVPEGMIDPWLRTLSFWNEDQAVAALHAYATHPMSFYRTGGVSFDFVGMARKMMQRQHVEIFQIYASGCSGDVTAGKYNDGSPDNREPLAKRLHAAMSEAFAATKMHPLTSVTFRKTNLELPFRKSDSHSIESMTRVLRNKEASNRERVLAAMGLASRTRIDRGQMIDFPCLDFGAANLVLFPGETWVGYQLMAQQHRPDSTVISIGFGECWPGYIPTTQGFEDNFEDVWHWVAPGSDSRMAEAISEVLPAAKQVD